MFKVDCVTAQKPEAMMKAVNDTISTMTSSGYKILNVYPVTIGDSRYVSAIINYLARRYVLRSYIQRRQKRSISRRIQEV